MAESSKTKAYKGISSQTIIVIIMGVMELFYFSMMSRILSKEDFGYFAVISAVTMVLSGISEAGLGSAVIQKKNASDSFISTAYTLSIIIGILFTIAMFFFADYLSVITVKNNTLTKGFQISSVLLFLYSLSSLGRSFFMRKLEFLKFGIIQIISYFLSSVIGIIMALQNFGFYSALWATILYPTFLLTGIYLTGAIKFNIHINYIEAKQILSFGGWLTGSTILRTINTQVDKLIISHWLPIVSLGIYNRPSGFINSGIDKVNSIFDVVLFPVLSNIQDDKGKILSSYYKSVTLVHLFSVIITCVLLLGTEVIVKIFFGDGWMGIYNIFSIISLSTIFVCYGRIADCYFRSLGEVRSYFIRRLIVLFSTVICVYLGCQSGIRGLAIGMFISTVIDSLIRWGFLVKILGFSSYVLIRKMINVAWLPWMLAMLCLLLKNNSWFNSLLMVLAYFLLLFVSFVFFPKLYGDLFFHELYLKIKIKLIQRNKLVL